MKRTLGIVLIAIGIIMMVYTGFDYMTKEKVVEIGSIQINAEKDHNVQWPSIAGVALAVVGIAVILLDKKART